MLEVREMTYDCDIAFMDKNNDGVSEYAVIEAGETYDEYGMSDDWYHGNVSIYAGFNEDTATYHKQMNSYSEHDGCSLIHK